jgi:hypothetical protein
MGIVHSTPSRITTSTQLKKTGSTKRLRSIPDENDPQDQSIDDLHTPAKAPIPPRVLPGRKRLESGASLINSDMAAVVSTSTASACTLPAHSLPPQGPYVVSTGAGQLVFNCTCNTHDRQRRSCTRPQLSRQPLRHCLRCLHCGRCPLRCLPASRHRTRYRTQVLVWDPAPYLQGLQTIKRLQSLQTLHQTLSNSRSS